MVIGGRRGTLKDIDILTAHVLLNLYERFAIGKGTHLALTEWNTNVIGNFVGQR